MWKNYIAIISIIVVAVPMLTGAIYFHQRYKTKVYQKTVSATEYEKSEMHPLLNQESPFGKIKKGNNPGTLQQINMGNVPTIPNVSNMMIPKPQIPNIPGQQMHVQSSMLVETPTVKSIVYNATNAIGILDDGRKEVIVEVGQTTKWGTVNEISEQGILIGGTLYVIKS